jgi:uncharacterized membrane protein
MTNDKIVIGNGLTGETIEREMTDAEQAERNAFLAQIKIDEQKDLELKASAYAKKTAALAKLEALGLDADDLAALGL